MQARQIKAVLTDFDQTLFDTSVMQNYPKGTLNQDTIRKYMVPQFTLFEGWIDNYIALKFHGIPFGVVSHNIKTTIKETLKKNKLDVDFVLSRYGENYHYPQRIVIPKAELLEQALNQPSLSGVKKEEILYLGDMGYDIEEARRFGCLSGACHWGTQEEGKLIASTPDFNLYSPGDLLEILGLAA